MLSRHSPNHQTYDGNLNSGTEIKNKSTNLIANTNNRYKSR